MSIFSDVAIAVRNDVLERLPDEILDWLINEAEHEEIADCSSRADEDRGRLFIIRDTKWDKGYDDVAAFYNALMALPNDEGYLVLETCHEYPETDSNDKGGWVDNPFHLRKYLKAELTWAEV